jgi:hypothetical protein
MKLEVGMYVSTTDRKEIGKITHFCECENCKERGYLEPVIDNPNIFITIYDKENKFHGYKFYDTLTDLIQVGDYVNGNKIIKISTDYCGRNILIYGYDDGDKQVAITIYEDEIKSIVTKEQFSSMEYKVC